MTRPGVLQLVAEHTSIVCAFAHPKRREQTSASRIGAVVGLANVRVVVLNFLWRRSRE